MTTAVEPVAPSFDLTALKERYLSLTSSERLKELERLHQRGMENAICWAALAWAMKERGDDMTPVEERAGDMLQVYLYIGSGTLTVNALRRWGKRFAYLRVIMGLIPADQERLCQGPIPVVEQAPEGTFTHRLLQLNEIVRLNLTAQVFDKGMIRSVPQQEAWLKYQPRKSPRPDVEIIGAAKIDRVAEKVRVGNNTFTFDEWRRIARRL